MPQPGRVIISEAELQTRIVELGAELARDLGHERPILVGVLQGAFLFMADLIRATPIELTTDFIGVASYAGGKSSGQVRIVSDLSVSIEYQGSGRLLAAQAHSSAGDKLLEQILAATSE